MMKKAAASKWKPNKHLRAVLFDLEGVLVDHVSSQIRLCKQALTKAGLRVHVNMRVIYPLRSYPFMHQDVPFFQAVLALDKIGASWALRANPKELQQMVQKQTQHLSVNQLQQVEQVVAFYHAARRNPHQLSKHIKSIPGTAKLLKQLKKNKFRIGLITNANPEMARYLLKREGIAKYFDAIVTKGEARYGKPHPQGVKLLLRKLDTAPDQAILIEDSLAGIQAGKRAKLQATIGVLTGLAPRRMFQTAKEKPDVILNRAEELLPLLA